MLCFLRLLKTQLAAAAEREDEADEYDGRIFEFCSALPNPRPPARPVRQPRPTCTQTRSLATCSTYAVALQKINIVKSHLGY